MSKIKSTSKIYAAKNVYEASLERLEFAFDNYSSVCFSFSGGKDSGVMVQLAYEVAKKKGKKFSVLYIDLEAMMSHTVRYVEEVKARIASHCDAFYWVCLPLIEENATSLLQPDFITWDENAKEKWVREMPKDCINLDNNPFDFYSLTSFEEFTLEFCKWYNKKKGGITACAVGIRTDESLHRFMAITSTGKKTFRDTIWSTPIFENIYNIYPIYDWKVGDIWATVGQKGFLYNEAYELMYKMGVRPHEQRICQPFGSAQKAGLHQIAEIDGQAWNKMVERVSGVNFGAIYQRTTLLGSISSYKPKHMTWQQYAVYLLESIGLYEPKIMNRYYQKIKYYMKWSEVHEGIAYGTMAEEATGRAASWKRVARALEKNDFFLSSLEFGPDKAGDKLLLELSSRHKLIGEGYAPPVLKRTIAKLEKDLQ